jgi:signal transduction histidine kinase
MIRSIDQVLQPAIQQKNLTVTLEYSEQALPVQIDSGYLRESISRIWRNAIRHTPDGGSIMIRSNSTEGMAVFEITDTGVGISEEDLPRIFERFFRTDEAGTTRGFGLGLPIARAIIERHHGRIEVESQVGQGSTFRVFLPLDRGN